ncbi:sugar transporter SWEET1 [Diorhabda carinulata]|uniref:sugar transporter SWEET1 n=1 Tax=Diorhabda carinulata TaxID=1163345 RepID=UPI0025A023C2|nr:sugar transporter SWEET1 [Diorhabda carinulata]
MEKLSNTLQPYKNVVGQAASILTIAQFFSGTFICKEIYHKKSTAGIPAVPFIGGLTIGILMLKLALLMDDPAMLQVNIAAIILNTLYTAFYYFYSKDRYNEIWKPFSVAIGMMAVFLGYASIEDPAQIEFRYSLLVTVLMLMLVGSPLMDVKGIIEKKDSSSIPFPLTFMGSIVSFLWLLYGIILMNIFMVVQNVIGLILCMIQLWLVYKYPANPGQDEKQKKAAKIN